MANHTDKRGPMPPALQGFAGIYLLYTAWNLRTALAEKPLFLIAIILFAIAGAGLIVFAGWRMYQQKNPAPPAADAEEENAEE